MKQYFNEQLALFRVNNVYYEIQDVFSNTTGKPNNNPKIT